MQDDEKQWRIVHSMHIYVYTYIHIMYMSGKRKELQDAEKRMAEMEERAYMLEKAQARARAFLRSSWQVCTCMYVCMYVPLEKAQAEA